ncbi:DUF4126 domain-containing protein [Bryobacter aggregatus]|uniref:DUF4126 domain-containing protein n=1 Tax=Bryobacter aggregatus TaxID=360054 RepID=UPI00068D7D7A|nr:DUF4126 domain-containing protein [Bryobacter aggregatus]
MNFTQGLSGILALGVASGLNLYATVLTLGIAQHFGWIHGLPAGLEVLSHPWVLGVAALLYALEFIADKVPGFTPLWDSLHTFIRPVGGALLAMGAVGNLDPKMQTIAMLVGGSVALGTHATKMGTRLAAHVLPDPVTHSAMSVAEDFGVVGILVLAYNYPWVALPILLVIVACIAVALPFLLRVLRFLLRTVTGRLLSFSHPDADVEIPAWARVAGSQSVLGFVRSGKGLGRLRHAYLSMGPGSVMLHVKGLFGKEKTFVIAKREEPVRGLFIDYVEMKTDTGIALSIYFTKDWASYYRQGLVFQ